MNSCFWGDVRMKELRSCSVTVTGPGPLAQHATSQMLRGQGLQLRKTLFLRQPSEETGERVSGLPARRQGARGMCVVSRVVLGVGTDEVLGVLCGGIWARASARSQWRHQAPCEGRDFWRQRLFMGTPKAQFQEQWSQPVLASSHRAGADYKFLGYGRLGGVHLKRKKRKITKVSLLSESRPQGFLSCSLCCCSVRSSGTSVSHQSLSTLWGMVSLPCTKILEIFLYKTLL